MSLRVVILYNDDQGLARASQIDRFAASAVQETARAVEKACLAQGWDAWPMAIPVQPQQILQTLSLSGADAILISSRRSLGKHG